MYTNQDRSLHKFLTGGGLLSTNGLEHRRQRKLLNPVFSHANMRRIAPLMRDISRQLRDVMLDDVSQRMRETTLGAGEIDCAEHLGRAALEFIAQAGFGHTFHAMEGTAEEYVHAIKDQM